MSYQKYSPYCSCLCDDYKSNKKHNKCRRSLRNNEKVEHWNARNSSTQMCTILSPDAFKQDSVGSCDCLGEVTKKCNKIKWTTTGNKQVTYSRYHKKCGKKSPNSKAKLKKPKVTRNLVISKSCIKCEHHGQRCKFSNQCYCCYPPNQPILPIRPMLNHPNQNKDIKSPELPEGSLRTLETLRKANELLRNYSPESQFLLRLRNKAKAAYDCECDHCKLKKQTADLEYTSNRKLLEEAYGNFDPQKKYSPDMHTQNQCFKPHKITLPNKEENCVCDSKNSKCICVSKNDKSMCKSSPKQSVKFSSLDQNLIDAEKIQAIKTIRNDNYFDTHSIQMNLSQTKIPNHKCLHRFSLDERLLPAPINANNDGISCCAICNKPMENNSEKNKANAVQETNSNDQSLKQVSKNKECIQTNETNISTSREKQDNLKNFSTSLGNSTSKQRSPTNKLSNPNRQNYNSNPQTLSSRNRKFPTLIQSSARKINFPTENTRMELKVPSVMMADPKYVQIDKSCASSNSWALRFQKGVI